MKNKILTFLFFFICISLYGQNISFDDVIRNAANVINSNLPQNAIVAVSNFEIGIRTGQPNVSADFIITEITRHFVNFQRYRVVDRQRLDEAKKELDLNKTAGFNLSDAQRIGNFVGADIVIFGYIRQVGDIYHFYVQANRTETGDVISIFTTPIDERNVRTRIPPPPSPPRQKYSFFNGLTIFGYSFSFGTPLGFTLGAYGVYTTLNFALPNWGNSIRVSYRSELYSGEPYSAQNYSIVNWIMGYNITLIPNTLYLPIGAGVEATKEWRLQKDSSYASGAVWNPAAYWETHLLLEAGLLFRVKTSGNFAPYIFGSYRNVGITSSIYGNGLIKHNLSIGVGGSFDFLAK